MKPLSLAIFLAFLVLNNLFALAISAPMIDSSLPKINEVRVLADVSAIGFEWDKIDVNKNIKGIAVYEVKGDKAIKKAEIKNPNSTHFVLTSLKPDTEIKLQFHIIGANNTLSEPSPIIFAKTSFVDPVEDGFAISDYPKMIKLIWAPHPNPSIVRYIIQRSNDRGVFLNIATIKSRLQVEFFDKDLDDGAEYSYRIIAQDLNGVNSIPSKVFKATTRNKPQVITNLVASNNLYKEIALKWKESERINVTYEIFASSAQNARFSKIGETKKTSFKEKNLGEGIIRFYEVRAIDDSGIVGDFNETIKGTTLPPLPIPHIISHSVLGKNYAINWENIKSSRIKSYALYKVAGKEKSIRFEPSVKNSFIDRDVKSGVKYVYWVVSIDSSGNESSPSEKIEVVMP